ncbi:Fungal-trans domain-containing protein [Fusarium falciforme]|uniref:Fungal-trans domain-containing protein n=1 Tax=Fusarium falciforme TaxID=195108 RepID=UPI0022FFFC0D|nr:Fungal-trans domain-containing protein [Fusarium falciforme]WAO90230.1 Fungal-trans domain-containing protein [Fusarium falciforme]
MAAILQANICETQNTQASTTRATASREEILKLVEPHHMYAHVSDGSVLTGPPLVIVEAMIEPYFEMVNPHMPLWTKKSFCYLMESAPESSNASDKRAYDVCANNLVLLTLQAKSLHSRAVSSRTSTEASRASSIDMDLIKSFIANAKRALENVELLLLNPSLLTLQALLSLCLVAQTSLSEDVAALVFSFAVHVAKSIGLRHWSPANTTERANAEECQEKQQVMYCMVCLSRALAWASGLSFNLPSVDLLERSLSTSSTTSHLVTRVALLRLEEQIYSVLYSDEATDQGPSATGKVALSQGRKLDDWAASHPEELDEGQYSGTLNGKLCHDLAVRFYSIQALVLWRIPGDASMSPSILGVARRSLRFFQRLWTVTSERGHHLDLALLVASYPPVPFFELSRHALTNRQASDEDWELLHSFSSMIRMFSEWAEENSLMKRLLKFCDIMLHLIDADREEKSSRRPESRPASVGQAYIHTLEPIPGNMVPIVHPYGGDSVASSSRSTSTPISGFAQPMHPTSDTEPVSLPTVSESIISSSLGSFDGVFGGRLSPIGDLEGWIVEPGAPGAPLPNSMPNFMFQDGSAFSFDRIDLG